MAKIYNIDIESYYEELNENLTVVYMDELEYIEKFTGLPVKYLKVYQWDYDSKAEINVVFKKRSYHLCEVGIFDKGILDYTIEYLLNLISDIYDEEMKYA